MVHWPAMLAPVLLAATFAIVNARVWTGDSHRPWAEAVAISGERIVAVGSNEEIRKCAGASARIIDARGAAVTPGFNDAHIHLYSRPAARPDPPLFLRYIGTKAELVQRVAARAASTPKGTWILGFDWDERNWGGALPTREWLDRVSPDHPVWLTHLNADAGLANSAELRAAGISLGAKPSGLIRGGPMALVEAALVETTREEDDRALEAVMRRLPEMGVTSVQHNNGWSELLILERLHKTGRLSVRVYDSVPLPSWKRLQDYIAVNGRGDAWHHWGGLKGFGVIPAEDFYRWTSAAARGGMQVMVHTGGPEYARMILSTYDRVRREQNLKEPRFRMEHGHDLPPDLIPLLVSSGTVASWQPPLLAHFDVRTAAGAPAPKYLFPCRAVLDAGVVIAFGTDAAAQSFLVSPLESIQMALERPGPDGSRITLDEALRAYTWGAAYAEFAEEEKGTLEPGKLADLVLFETDIFRLPARQLKQAQVRMTMVGGRVKYEAPPPGAPR